MVAVWPGREDSGLGPWARAVWEQPPVALMPAQGQPVSEPTLLGVKGPWAWDIFIGGARGQTQREKSGLLALLTDTVAATVTLCLEACSPSLPKAWLVPDLLWPRPQEA